ncbi:hypothetical protein EBZ37_04870 [bacterium]|nr:hypothetical protein [bacterium]
MCSSLNLAFAAESSDWLILQRPDGTVQCEAKPSAQRVSKLISAVRRELRKAKIQALEVRRLESDGKVRIQMCGSPTGAVVQIKVREADKDTVKKLGFVEVSAK